MALESPSRFLVAHTLRIKGSATAEAVARAGALSAEAVEDDLAALAGEGLAVRREGLLPGWSLTAEGRARHARSVREQLIANGARPAVETAYRRFLELNADVLELCTAWQLRTVDGAPTPNDHTDAGYDDEVVRRLRALDEQVDPVLVDLGAALTHFQRYRPRLRHALERVLAGERQWFTGATIDSYHTVWFELHEDLLRTLGLERGGERSPEASTGRHDETETA